jgi:hypothetical protein
MGAMQLHATNFITDMFSPPALPAGPIQVSNPDLDPLIATQPRFRVQGSGPLTSRVITPETPAAQALVAAGGTAEQAVRRVLSLVEDAAGGPEASSKIGFHGVSFSDSDLGQAANAYRAQLDDDPVLRAQLTKQSPRTREQQVKWLGEHRAKNIDGVLAHVVSGWMNLGTAASNALLQRGAPASEQDLADAVRTVVHESVHAADPAHSGLSREAHLAFSEAVADTRTTTLPSLQRGRQLLGLDGVVGDAALGASLRIRPYEELERRLANAMDIFGAAPDSIQGKRILRLPLPKAVDAIVDGIARSSGESAQLARTALDMSLTEAWKQLKD